MLLFIYPKPVFPEMPVSSVSPTLDYCPGAWQAQDDKQQWPLSFSPNATLTLFFISGSFTLLHWVSEQINSMRGFCSMKMELSRDHGIYWCHFGSLFRGEMRENLAPGCLARRVTLRRRMCERRVILQAVCSGSLLSPSFLVPRENGYSSVVRLLFLFCDLEDGHRAGRIRHVLKCLE